MGPLLMPSLLLLALVGALPGAWAECPVAADLKPTNGTRLCARLYEKSDAYYENCCAGAELSLEPDTDLPYLPSNWYHTASSLVVGTRCEMTVWHLKGKYGKTRKFSAGAYPRLSEYRRGILGNWNNAIGALYCKCT